MKSIKLFHTKEVYGRGFIEIVIWHVPQCVSPSAHHYKYRLVYVVDGKRMVGYDNERGKGDHKHVDNHEEHYHFVDPASLMTDFLSDVKGVQK
ncbi:MAG: hypothetical protein KGI54_13085 [Pseudomonadota bacterium]|nr:hypothetical protein [Pseudomonadota bacterium]